MKHTSRHRFAALLCAASLSFGSISSLMMPVHAADGDPDQTIYLHTGRPWKLNDTDGDGLGEFDGWGASLCWWANRLGYSDAMAKDAAKKFFSDEGLDLNIGRYNIGGGDATTPELNANAKCVLYGLDKEHNGPEYSGTSMRVSTNFYNAGTLWERTDRDLGILKGARVGSLQEIGWVGPLDGEPGQADTLKYTVHADKAGTYQVKLLFKLVGGNPGRHACIRINGTETKIIDENVAEQNVIARQDNAKIYLGTFEDVELKEGDNTIEIGGNPQANNPYMYDFISMHVVANEDSIELPTSDPGLHKEHITRSDSALPGYCVDVTRIALDETHTIDWYKDNFERVDEKCGYAWNYDWNADKTEYNVLEKALAVSGDEFIVEAFSTTPPYFMCESLCSSGGYDPSKDNLRPGSHEAFVTYLVDVIEHLQSKGVKIQSLSAFNEPNSAYWKAYSPKQEGCHFDTATMDAIIPILDRELKERNIDLILSAADETSIDVQTQTIKDFSKKSKDIIDRIDVHTYTEGDRAALHQQAANNQKNLWMSEVDGSFEAGENAGEMTAPLGLAHRIIDDVAGMKCNAWVFWNLIDAQADSSDYGMSFVEKGSELDKPTVEDHDWYGRNYGFWGLACGDHNNQEVVLSMKYYGFGQFTRYIRPGYTLFESTGNTLSAYDPVEKKAVIVAINDHAADSMTRFNLGGFTGTPSKVTAIRTSGSMESGEKWADVSASDSISIDTDNKSFTANLKGNSITTYIVEGVGEMKKAETRPLKKITVDNDHITSSTPYNNSSSNTAYTLQDGDYNTYFDGYTSSECPGYVIYDLQKETEIAAFSYAPRYGFAWRCNGAEISGSHDGETWTPLYTIPSAPAEGKDTVVNEEFFDNQDDTFRYIRYTNSKEDANIAEFKVYTYDIATNAWFVDDSHNTLPETMTIEGKECPVEWTIEDAFKDAKPFETVAIKGLAAVSEEETAEVTAFTQLIPANLEYMIDCNSPSSLTHQYALASSSKMKNKVSDQEKTDDNAWGTLSIIGGHKGADITTYGVVDNSDPYNGGYYALKGKAIDYAVTLPAGDHTIMIGNSGWWSMGRTMELVATTSEGEIKLTDCNAHNSAHSAYSAKLHLDKEETVRLTIRKTDGNDPIVSWLAIASDSKTENGALAKRVEEIEAENLTLEPDATHKYTMASWNAFTKAMENAKSLLEKADATQNELDDALIALNNARDGLTLVNLHPALIVSNYAHALDLSIFLEKGQSEMNANLEAADAQIEAPESQDSLSSSAGNLNKSLFDLRIKPSEDILKERYGK